MLRIRRHIVITILNTAARPSEEVPVRCKAQDAYISHRIAPDLTGSLSGNIAQRQQMEKGASAPAATGSLYRFVQAGRSVEGGQREEMKREDQRRRVVTSAQARGSQ